MTGALPRTHRLPALLKTEETELPGGGKHLTVYNIGIFIFTPLQSQNMFLNNYFYFGEEKCLEPTKVIMWPSVLRRINLSTYHPKLMCRTPLTKGPSGSRAPNLMVGKNVSLGTVVGCSS